MKKKTDFIDRIESTLAQTQCQLCEYQDCRAYAKAIVEDNERIDRCLPGGEKTLRALAELTEQNPEPYLEYINNHTKTITLAVIREHECIGCTKCIQACPVDAIIGSGKQMHTVITDACNGCELCIPPCPVDCIDTVVHPRYQNAHEIAQHSKVRYEQHRSRKQKRNQTKTLKKDTLEARKAAIKAAIKRTHVKQGQNHEPEKT